MQIFPAKTSFLYANLLNGCLILRKETSSSFKLWHFHSLFYTSTGPRLNMQSIILVTGGTGLSF